MNDVITPTAFWLAMALFAAIGLGISVAKSWQRASASLDPETLAQALANQDLEPETDSFVFDQDLAPGTDLDQWEKDMK